MEKVNPEDVPAEVEATQLDLIEEALAEIAEAQEYILRIIRTALLCIVVSCAGLLLAQAVLAILQ